MLKVNSNIHKYPNFYKRYLTATLDIDGYRTAAPFFVEKGDRTYLVARHLDRGNMEELKKQNLLPEGVETVYFKPYFAFYPISPEAIGTYDETIAYVAEGDKDMHVCTDMSVQHYSTFAQSFNVTVEGETYMPLKYVYEFDRSVVIDRFAQGRDQAVAIAKNLVRNSRDKDEFYEILDSCTDTRFEAIDAAMEGAGLDWLFLTSCLGIQELTGFGMEHFTDEEVAALYKKGSDTVLLLSARILDNFGKEKVLYDPVGFIKETIQGGVTGIEELHCCIGWYQALELNETNSRFAHDLVRDFRLRRGDFNLPYYIIAARAGTYAIENAIMWAKDQVVQNGSVDEADINVKHDELVREFVKANGILFTVDKYWTGLHASDRSITPSYAFPHKVTKSSKALKIDAGLKVKDSNGILRAVSDIARNIQFDDFADVYYEIAEGIMTGMVEAIHPGMTGDEIYRMTMAKMEENRPTLEEIGMIPAENCADVFSRDVGHGISLHEPGTLWFDKGVELTVEQGMICAHEIQWSTQGYSIGTEDNFIVGKAKGLNMCRD